MKIVLTVLLVTMICLAVGFMVAETVFAEVRGTSEIPEGYELPNYLGEKDPNLVVGRIIQIIMGFVGTIALVIFIYGGVLWLISAGRPEYVNKGRGFMIWAAVGLIVVFAAYIIVRFVTSYFTG